MLFRRLLLLLTVVVVRVGAEEDAEARLVVDGPAAGVGTAHVDAVGEHEGPGQAVHHIAGRGVHEARDHLEANLLGRAVKVLGRSQRRR